MSGARPVLGREAASRAASIDFGDGIGCLPAMLLAATLAVTTVDTAHSAEKVLPEGSTEIELSFSPLVKKVAPAVVNVFTRKIVETRTSPLFDDPFFKKFFGEDFGFGPPEERVQNSLGSGVIVSSDGLVVTNDHVIRNSDQITVILGDRREFDATIVTRDERTDLALLRIDSRGEALPTLALRDSDELEVGDLVLAIGNPFGVGQTVTSGIVSALARTHIGVSDLGFFIQTDAAINPGNSGGALVSMDGRLVGINTAIYSRTGGSVGIGFAIPSNMVATVVAAAGQGGRVVRPWIGAGGQALTAELAEGLGLDRPGGVIINNVYPGGPAARGGLELGDIVIAVNGREVADPQALRFRLATLAVGGTADLRVRRQDHEIGLTIDLVEAPETPPRNETLIEDQNPLSGATVVNLSPAVAEEMSLDGAVWSGVVIVSVRRGSVAHRARLAPGDVVMKVNDDDIGTVEDLRRALDRRDGAWRITFRRGGDVRTLVFG